MYESVIVAVNILEVLVCNGCLHNELEKPWLF
jgi:hypothetical protein